MQFTSSLLMFAMLLLHFMHTGMLRWICCYRSFALRC